MTGVVLLDKPSGISSARALGALKKKLQADKAGHAGTLDPMATGLLVCLLGRATRLASFAESGRKVYTGRMRFGMTTSTDDIEGEVLTSSGAIPALEAVRAALHEFRGKISQVPPAVSAVKIDGVRAYQRARRGEVVQISAREVEVFSFEISGMSGEEAEFRVECSPGTYIRSLARDLGERLDCGGCLSALRREGSAPFSVDAACTLDSASPADVLPWTVLFPHVERLELPKDLAARILRGDERALGACGASSEPDRPVIYGTREVACGLLLPEARGWSIGANVLSECEL